MDSLEREELILYAAGLSEEEVDKFMNDGEDIDDFCHEKFDIDSDQFVKVAEALLKLTPVVCASLNSKERLHAFVVPLGDKGMRSVVMTPAK